MRKCVRLCLAVAVLVVGGNLADFMQQAEARWKPKYADAPYRQWFEQQRDNNGLSCCDHSDAHAAYDAYIKDGKWHVPIHGRDYKIYLRQLLDGPNPTGHAVVWYDATGDHIVIYCFAPGPML
jgi:hypothetical protein